MNSESRSADNTMEEDILQKDCLMVILQDDCATENDDADHDELMKDEMSEVYRIFFMSISYT